MSEIEQAMSDHLRTKHELAQDKISKARKALRDAVNSVLEVSQLTDKVRSHYGKSAHQWMRDNVGVTTDQSKAYLTALNVSTKRDVANDRRCLCLLGLMDRAPALAKRSRKVSPLSASTVASKASVMINKSLKQRSIADMSQSERHLLKSNLEDIAKIYLEASR